MYWKHNPVQQQHQCRQLEHQMTPMTRSGFRRVRAMFPAEFKRLTQTRFRSSDDFSPIALIAHLEMSTGYARLDTLTPSTHQLYLEVNTLTAKFLCTHWPFATM